MEILKERIVKDGKVISSEILKVDSFLNHQMDPLLMKEIGDEFAKNFKDEGIEKVFTIEASGIAVGIMAGLALNVPVVFAKKKKPSTMDKELLVGKVYSFTKNSFYEIIVSKEFIKEGEKILIVGDFLAHGNAAAALAEMVESAGAVVSGIGIVIEKGFQNGRKVLEGKGYRVNSLAIVEKMEDGKLFFK